MWNDPVDGRPSSRERGYDADWERVRLAHLAVHPHCAICLARGVVTPARIVDHIRPIDQRPDLRLEPANLQSICAGCHDRKTQADKLREKRARRQRRE